jgi:hypothetical protein
VKSKAKAEALKAYRERVKKNKGIKQKNNYKLYAGSPMYFYCRECGEEMALPEVYTPPAPDFCDKCSFLIRQGWLT